MGSSGHGRWIISWQGAEQNAAEWMRVQGYADAAVTGGGADAGVDVRSGHAIAQVKYEANHVGRPALQRLYGARGPRTDLGMLFFTGSNYSAHAVEYAAVTGIALFTYAQDGTISPVNAHAREIVAKQSSHATGVDSELERLKAHMAAPGYSPPQTQPRNPKTVGWWAIAGGLFCVWGLVAGVFNEGNFDDRGDIVPALVVVPLLVVGAYFLLRFGIRRVRR